MPAYCLFCETQKCGIIARIIERCWGIRCVFPQIVQREWKGKTCRDRLRPLLPGYLFLYPEEPLPHRIRMPGIIRTLGGADGILQDEDLAFATMLEEHQGVIGSIRLAEAGDRCTIADPLWQKTEGKVIKVDRGRKRCCVEFTFDNVRRTVWLGYDLVRPAVPEESPLLFNPAGQGKGKENKEE